MAVFPNGKWSFLGAVYLCPVARLEWDGSTCKVSPWAYYWTGASTMSPYTPGDPVIATGVEIRYTESTRCLNMTGSFDFGKGMQGLKGSFTAEVFSDYSLALTLKYSSDGAKQAESSWYGTVDTKSISARSEAAGQAFLIRYMSGDVAGDVVGASVGALKVADIGAGWTYGYGMVAAKAGLGVGVSAPSWSDWYRAQVPGGSRFPDWSGKPFYVLERGSAPYGYNQAVLSIVLSGSVTLSCSWAGLSPSLGLEVKAAWGGGGKLGSRADGGPYLATARETNPISLKI